MVRIPVILAGVLMMGFVDCGDDRGFEPVCPDMSGSWQFEYACPASSMAVVVEVTQDRCEITSSWEDDKTSDETTMTGIVVTDGGTSITIDFGDVCVTCAGELSGDAWTSDCAPGTCQLIAARL